MRRLNNKGYMLVEIILAFVLAMAIMYFITELTIKVKYKNDDLLVRSLTATDQTIIYNILMKDYYFLGFDDNISCNCNGINCVLMYGDNYATNTKVILNEYVDYCSFENNKVVIRVSQLPNENFDVVLPS